MPWFAFVVLMMIAATYAQEAVPTTQPLSPEQAMQKLKERQAARRAASTQPEKPAATQPTPPKRVVFVIQAGGSVLNQFTRIRQETESAIQNLDSRDYFNIIVEQEQVARPFHLKSLVPATDAWKNLAAQMLEDRITPRGRSSLWNAFHAAAEMRPSVIWVESIGNLQPENKSLILAEHLQAKVSTVVIPDGSEFNSDEAAFLWDLAHEHDGICITLDGKPITQRPGAPSTTQRPPVPPSLPQQHRPSIFDDK